MKKLLSIIFIAVVLALLGKFYIEPAMIEFNEDVQAYHSKNLLP